MLYESVFVFSGQLSPKMADGKFNELIEQIKKTGGKILKKEIGVIKTKKIADCIFLDKHALDLEPMHNPYASIVHRASQSTIKAVMIGGNIVHGKI